VKDPIWPLRNMLDVSFSVKPGNPTRCGSTCATDPPGRPHAVLTISGAGADFGALSLEGAEVRLLFKPRAEAAAEHVLDRFTQVRDNYAHSSRSGRTRAA